MSDSTNFDSNAVEVRAGDKAILLASWRFPRDGRFSQLWNITTGARATLSTFLKSLQGIQEDPRLSEVAQKEDSKARALEALKDLGQRQRGLNSNIEANRAEFLKLSAIAPYSGQTAAADAVVDCEIAALFRSLSGDARADFLKRMLSGEYHRELDAALRLPPSLMGLTPEARSALESSALQRREPDAVAEFSEYFEASRTTQWILRKVFDHILGASSLTVQEQMSALGQEAWEPFVKLGPKAAMQALADRYVA